MKLFLKDHRNILFLQSSNDIELSLESRQPGYINELVKMKAKLIK